MNYDSKYEKSLGITPLISEASCVVDTTFGKYCEVAGQHPLNHAALHHFTYRSRQFGMGDDHHEFFERHRARKVFLGHDVWIGHGAVVMPGIQIGTGAVIGSGSIVTHNVRPFSIVAGAPAKTIRERFPTNIQDALMEICWWNWSKQILRTNWHSAV